MSPRALDDEVVRNKLDAIDRACATLAKVGPVDAARLEQDPLIAAAVERHRGRGGSDGAGRLRGDEPSAASRQKSATGLTGTPVNPWMRGGAMINRKL